MKKTLAGLRILNTRPKDQAELLTQDIIKAGGTVIACPTLEIKARSINWVKSLPNLSSLDFAIFVSGNAVDYYFSVLKQEGLHWPKTIKIVAIGLNTAKALEHFGVDVHEMPQMPDSEHLLALKSLATMKNQHVLLVKGQGGRPLIEEVLLEKKAQLHLIEVYERVLPKHDSAWIQSIWHNELVDLILITSETSLNHLFLLFGEEARPWLERKTYCVISERLAKAASVLGIKKLIISHPNRILETLFDYYKGLPHG